MIYVSSSCVKASTIGEAVQQLARAGYTSIELSGGTKPYPELEEDLLRLQKEFGLSYLCHNYFPPPPRSFVINLASLNDEIAQLSLDHLRRSIALSKKLGAKKFGFHAGFLMDIPLNELGQSIAKQELFNREAAMNRFAENLRALKAEAGDVNLYIENNVVSSTNLKNYDGVNPLFVTDAAGYNEIRQRVDVSLLLDVAHLKVSCHSLGLDLEAELNALLDQADYVHVSDNDALTDNNGRFTKDSSLWSLMRSHDLRGKTFTLEVYTGPDHLRSSYEALMGIC